MFTFVKRIETTKDSIFYSFIHYKNEILGFGRKHYNDIENKIKFTTLCFLKEWEKLGTEKMLNKYEK